MEEEDDVSMLAAPKLHRERRVIALLTVGVGVVSMRDAPKPRKVAHTIVLLMERRGDASLRAAVCRPLVLDSHTARYIAV